MENLRKVFNAELSSNNCHNKRLQSPNCGIVSVGAEKSSCLFTRQEDPALEFNSKNFFTASEELEKEHKKKLLIKFLKDKRKYFIKRENKENIYAPKNYSLDYYDLRFLFEQELEKLKQKQIFDDEENFKVAVCKDCGNVINKKAIPLKSYSRYSSNEGNVKAMIIKYKKRLQTIFRKVPRVKEFFISYSSHPAYYKSLLSDYRKLNNLLFKEVEKLGIAFPCLQVVDFKIEEILNSDGKKIMWRVHFHFLTSNLKQKYFDNRVWKRAQREVERKTGVYPVVGFGKYKKKNKILRYFAKIMACQYSLNQEHHNTSLNQIITGREYLLNFFGMRSYGIRAKKGDSLLKFDNSFFEWLCSKECLLKFQNCPFCGKSHIIFLSPEQLKDFKPPDPDFVVETMRKQQEKINGSPLQKRFSRCCKSQEGKFKKSDLDFEDHLNLLATGKC